MEDVIYYNNLYDLYGCLLTDKQKQYFEDYYFNNLSLGEMADNYNVSRNAIFKQIHTAIEKLEEYEENLHFLSKLDKLYRIIDSSGNDKLKKQIDNLFLS